MPYVDMPRFSPLLQLLHSLRFAGDNFSTEKRCWIPKLCGCTPPQPGFAIFIAEIPLLRTSTLQGLQCLPGSGWFAYRAPKWLAYLLCWLGLWRARRVILSLTNSQPSSLYCLPFWAFRCQDKFLMLILCLPCWFPLSKLIFSLTSRCSRPRSLVPKLYSLLSPVQP